MKLFTAHYICWFLFFWYPYVHINSHLNKRKPIFLIVRCPHRSWDHACSHVYLIMYMIVVCTGSHSGSEWSNGIQKQTPRLTFICRSACTSWIHLSSMHRLPKCRDQRCAFANENELSPPVWYMHFAWGAAIRVSSFFGWLSDAGVSHLCLYDLWLHSISPSSAVKFFWLICPGKDICKDDVMTFAWHDEVRLANGD